MKIKIEAKVGIQIFFQNSFAISFFVRLNYRILQFL